MLDPNSSSKLSDGVNALEKTLPLINTYGLAAAIVILVFLLVAVVWLLGRQLLKLTDVVNDSIQINKSQAEVNQAQAADLVEIRREVSFLRQCIAVLLDREGKKAPETPPVVTPAK